MTVSVAVGFWVWVGFSGEVGLVFSVCFAVGVVVCCFVVILGLVKLFGC